MIGDTTLCDIGDETALVTERVTGFYEVTIELYGEFPRTPPLARDVPLPTNPTLRQSVLAAILGAYRAGCTDGRAGGRFQLQAELRTLLDVPGNPSPRGT